MSDQDQPNTNPPSSHRRRSSHDPEPIDDRSDCCKPQRDRYDKINTSVAVIGLVALIGYTTFAGYQSCQMKRSTDATKEAADAAVAASRPWITPAGIARAIWHLGNDHSPALTASWVNAGTTPALNIEGQIVSILTTREDLPDFTCPIALSEKYKPQSVGISLNRPLLPKEAMNTERERTLSDAELASWKKSETMLVFYGCITYLDVVSNRKRTTGFCFMDFWKTPENEQMLAPCPWRPLVFD